MKDTGKKGDGDWDDGTRPKNFWGGLISILGSLITIAVIIGAILFWLAQGILNLSFFLSTILSIIPAGYVMKYTGLWKFLSNKYWEQVPMNEKSN